MPSALNPRFQASGLLSVAELAELSSQTLVRVHFFAYPDKHLLLNPSVTTAVVLYLQINPASMSSREIYLYRNSSSVVWNIFWCLSGLKAHIASMSIITKKLNAWFDVDISGAFSKRCCIEVLDEWLSLSKKGFFLFFAAPLCVGLYHMQGEILTCPVEEQ